MQIPGHIKTIIRSRRSVLFLSVLLLGVLLFIAASKPTVKTSYTYSVTQPIGFQTKTNQTCNLTQGTNQVATKGKDGVETIKYRVNYVNGKKVSVDTLSDQTTTKPVDEIINDGIAPPKTSNLLPGESFGFSQCNINCNLTNIFSLEGLSSGITPQKYDAYVQLMQQNNCGPPEPYCSFTPSSACSSATTTSSGYDAGYQYAQDNQICDINYSNGNSTAFNQGVQDWASQNCTDGQPN